MLSGSAVALMDKSENVVVGSVVASYFPVIFFVGFILDIAGHAFCDGIIFFLVSRELKCMAANRQCSCRNGPWKELEKAFRANGGFEIVSKLKANLLQIRGLRCGGGGYIGNVANVTCPFCTAAWRPYHFFVVARIDHAQAQRVSEPHTVEPRL